MIKTVIKRNGSIEPFDTQKLVHWMEWAEVVGVDWPPIMMEVYKKTGETVTSADLHTAMIKAFLDLETEEGDKMAGRLFIGATYKQCYGDLGNIPSLPEFYQEMVSLGYWKDMGYTQEQLNKYDLFIDHDKDMDYSYTQLLQIVEKYSAQDRVTRVIFETPQFTFMRMALGLAENEKTSKDEDIWNWYSHFALNQTINAPTPNYVNLGTHNRGYASCILFTCDDSSESMATGDYIANIMTCASAGVGHHAFIRTEKDPIRGGIVSHKGKTNYYKSLAASINANTQSSRGGSATTHAFCLDPDTEDMIRMRHPTTVAKKRVPELDFSMGHVREFRRRVALNLDWPQVSYYGNEDLYKSAYTTNNNFEQKLAILESTCSNLKYIPARKLLLSYLKAANETGRKYHHNIDEINRHTPFKSPILQSNLCQEIVQPTFPFKNVEELYITDDSIESEISCCNLGAIIPSRLNLRFMDDGNWTENSMLRYESVCYYTLKMIDNIITMMDYPFPRLAYTAKARRNAGVGITGLAQDMAQRGLKYSSKEGKEYMHKLAELHSFSLHKASLRLAKERGVCEWAHKTKYPEGWLPIDTYNRGIDAIVQVRLLCDWESLREEIISLGGIRNSVLEAFMPCESSSLASGTTNSLYPIRDLKIIKTSDSGKPLRFIVPDMENLKDKYEIAWDIPVKDMLDCYGIFQKFCGQAISADQWVNKESEGKYSGKKALEDFLYGASIGVKTAYYTNTKNGGTEEQDSGCAEGVCKM